MSDRHIQPGDLVYVYRDCCGHYVGIHFVVAKIDSDFGQCGYCLEYKAAKMAYPEPSTEPKNLLLMLNFLPVEWLKRVPPLTDLEGELAGVPARTPEEVLVPIFEKGGLL